MKILIFAIFVTTVFCIPHLVSHDVDENLDEDVHGGIPAANRSIYPFYVYLSVHNGTRYGACGGSIIKYDWILTAAHCLENFVNVTIAGGMIELPDRTWAVFTNNTDLIVNHSGYNNVTLDNDIALIHLPGFTSETSIFANSSYYTSLIDLPTESDALNSFEGYTMRSIGFGMVNDTHPSELLRSGDTTIMLNQECKTTFPSLTSNQICVRTSHGVSHCKGDSGGPGRVRRSGQYIVLGVISFFSKTHGCAAGYPAGFINVSKYVKWINDRVHGYSAWLESKGKKLEPLSLVTGEKIFEKIPKKFLPQKLRAI